MDIPAQRYAGSVLPPLIATLTARAIDVSPALGMRSRFGPTPSFGAIPLAATYTAVELGTKLHDERAQFQTWYEGKKKDDGSLDMSAEDVKSFRERNDALGKLSDEYQAAKSVEDATERNERELKELKQPQRRAIRPEGPVTSADEGEGFKTLGEMFVESDAFKNRPSADGAVGAEFTIDVDKVYGKHRGFKTIFDTASSFAIQNVRLPAPITPAEQLVTVASLMPEGRTGQAAVAYMLETTTTNNAAETAESGTKPEAAIAFTEQTSTVRKIAVTLPVTDEALDDIPYIESYINNRLSIFVQQREDQQLLVGNGTPPNLRGIINTSGILTQARGSDASQDAIFKAAIKIESQGFLAATGVVLHPLNWQTIRLMTTADGIYLFGPPSQSGPRQIWGYDVVTTTAITQNTGLVGAFRTAAEVVRRTDLSMQIGWINDQFVKNQRTVLVEERLALVVYRPKGFCTVTSLN